MFYLKPPRGEIHSEKLFDLARKRLRVLAMIQSSRPTSLEDLFKDCVEDGEAVLEGTTKDRIAHFSLKLAATSGPRNFKLFFITQEKALFRLRLKSQTQQAKQDMLLELLRHLREQLKCNFTTEFQAWHEAFSKVSEENMLQNCLERNMSTVTVPFQMVPELVAKRAVSVKLGLAVISCLDLNELISSAFDYFFHGSLSMKETYIEDLELDKIRSLIKDISSNFSILTRSSILPYHTLEAENINSESAYFPPCFHLVHQKLVRVNRLQHSARVGYSLFLKEIGLGREGAMDFWSWHYSKASFSGSSCSHSWQVNQKKFTYSIDHLYGLEGSRKNYSAHSCVTIQQRSSSATEQLVCPFKTYSTEELKKALASTVAEDKMDIILQETNLENFGYACKLYMSTKYGVDVGGLLNITKPSEIYHLYKNIYDAAKC